MTVSIAAAWQRHGNHSQNQPQCSSQEAGGATEMFSCGVVPAPHGGLSFGSPAQQPPTPPATPDALRLVGSPHDVLVMTAEGSATEACTVSSTVSAQSSVPFAGLAQVSLLSTTAVWPWRYSLRTDSATAAA